MKFALISNVLPPSESAHAMIIHRLLRDLDPASYCLLSSRDYVTGDQPNYSGRLAGRHYYLPPTFQLTRGYRFGLQFLPEQANLVMGVALRARAIARILRREKCEAVVVCTGGNEILDFPAGYLASRLVGATFYPYLLDQYFHMVSYVLGKHFLQRVEPLLMKGAEAVIAPNEFLRDELRRRFKIEAVVIHNMCDLSVYDEPLDSAAAASEGETGEVRIVYTGGIGPLHYDAMRNMLAAIEALGREDVRLHLYTAQPREGIEGEGIRGRALVYHEHEPVNAMPSVQRGADVLFLPLAFDSPHPDIVRTAAPGKMGEFLAARRPILVHAPPDSFIAWYFRQHECGLVVDQNDPAQLARALDTILNDAVLREKLAARARERAEADFSLPKARSQFAEVLGLNDESR
ncbi:MAG: glycosyltransferase [Acidobacteria bacterium]|nr:glycosyltransferase [Acidobacteriota bacterium]